MIGAQQTTTAGAIWGSNSLLSRQTKNHEVEFGAIAGTTSLDAQDMGLVKPMEELVPSSSSSAVINSNISIGNSTSMIRPQLQLYRNSTSMM
ncbi:uncharacterized protein A4U43_C04F34060 [Asparagus officinalis]|uniref:Uncharacterized protein n=1 Tax=Asparagus officinalis TaxID=4686 RepID=A0A5P1FAK2_ASPOF|nr:uncharacterized protein A4U43_C04F34060 [Asparagus officinalis]